MRRTFKGLIAVTAATALAASGVGIASADTITADGDSLSTSNNFVVTDCSRGASRLASSSSGVARLAGTGNGTTSSNSHFRPGTNVIFSSVPSAAATSAGITSGVASPATVTLPSNGNNNWNNDHGVITKTITANVPAGVASGTYAITVTVSGTNHNTGGALSMSSVYSVVVSCSDTTGPVLSLPGTQVVEATSASGRTVIYTATALDDVDGAVTATCSPASGSTFALGATTVNCSATDTAGNATNGSFTVTVRDTTGPVVTPPANVTAEATSAAGAVVTYANATAADLVDGSVAASCLPASGSQFALGNTTVTCTATDTRGNSGSATFTVSVGDTTPPVVTVPGNQVLEATGPSGATYAYTPAPSATDAVAGSPSVTCSPVTGSTFGITTTTVTCSASDGNQTGSSSFTVTVQDTLGPVLSGIPATQTLEATSSAGAALGTFAPGASDVVDGAVAVVCKTAGNIVVGASFVYPLGATAVTCRATDAHANTGSSTYTITVVDTTGPILTLPTDITAEATSSAGAIVSFSATATDAVDGSVVPDCMSLSGSSFPLGTTTLSCTAADSRGNLSNTQSFTITVVDTTPPTIDAHSDVTEEATGATGAVVTYTAPATHDAVDGDGVATCAPSSGSTFALGNTTVTCSATDARSNVATPATFTVSVVDTTPPLIAAHLDEVAEATSAAGAVVNYVNPATSDAVDGAGTASCSPLSGSTFSLGLTTVTCQASDAAGNDAVATTFAVTVQDTTAPVVTVPGQRVAEATSAAGATVTFADATWTDAVDGAGTATCDYASGATFPLGGTTVTCSQTDAAGNPGSNAFMVVVQDTTAPIIAAHGDETGEATSASGAIVSYAPPTTSDAVDGPGVATCWPASGSQFALGSTVVNCSANDNAGNASIATNFTVTVVDTTAPVIASHADETAEATSAAGATVGYTAPGWTDAVDGSGTAACLPASGSTFPLGATSVTCTRTDNAGNAATLVTFTVTVVDTTAPVIASHADETAEATSAAGATVGYTAPGWADAVDGSGTATCLPASGSTFPLGATSVTCTRTDNAGNAATLVTFTVTVVDTTAPAIAAHADVTATATGASQAVVTYTSPTWTDAVDGSGTTSCTPPSGGSFPIGSTTITCTVTDSHGNTGTRSFHVIVSYAWSGFFQPIDAAPNNSNGKDSAFINGSVYNKVKAGSTVPVKFSLGGDQGLAILATGFPTSKQVTCEGTAPSDAVEEVTSNPSGLKYDASANQYIYSWKTLSSGWAGTCRQLQVKLADGTSHYAFFNFTK